MEPSEVIAELWKLWPCLVCIQLQTARTELPLPQTAASHKRHKSVIYTSHVTLVIESRFSVKMQGNKWERRILSIPLRLLWLGTFLEVVDQHIP